MTASWVITENQTGLAVFETFNHNLVNKINTEKYCAVPVMEYLQNLNEGIERNDPS